MVSKAIKFEVRVFFTSLVENIACRYDQYDIEIRNLVEYLENGIILTDKERNEQNGIESI